MEMEASTMPPKPTRLTVEEDALASQVLEINSGVTLGALQTVEEPEERDVWSVEEGDDSVFYSDEDQAHQDIKTNTPCGAGASKCKRLVNSVTDDEPIQKREDDQNSEKESQVTQRVILPEQGEEQQEFRTTKSEPMNQSDAADPGAQSNPTLEKSPSSCGESLQPNCTSADMQRQPEQIMSAEEANLPAQKEEVALDTQTPNLESFDVANEEKSTRLNGEAKVPEQMSSAELKTSGDTQLQVDREPQQHRNVHVPVGFHQSPSPGYSTLPVSKKPSAFDHLSASKYSTVSYRKIRRGNTRQKIKEFEVMMMNL